MSVMGDRDGRESTRWDEAARRWCVDGQPVHAGDAMEMQGVVIEYDEGEETSRPGEWFAVAIESRDGGRVLDAYKTIHGVTFCSTMVAGFDDEGEPFSVYPLRWPGSERDG